MRFIKDHAVLLVFHGATCLAIEKEVVDLTVDSSTHSNDADVECIIESSTNLKDSVDEDCTSGPMVPTPMDYCNYTCMPVQQ